MTGRLLETIKIQDGIIQNIIYHNQRFNKTRRHFWPNSKAIDLYEFIKIPEQFKFGTVRCRVLFNEEIEEIQFFEYIFKPINTLKIVSTEINYDFKWENRTEINELVAQNPNFDDILMVKNGFITDTSYANIVLKKDNEFFTPKKPMLNGTKRQHLIDEDIIIEKNIKPSDLKKYSHFAIINTFNDLDLTKFIPIKNIQK
jgi:4-amino-4-deoxychorismate lyase